MDRTLHIHSSPQSGTLRRPALLTMSVITKAVLRCHIATRARPNVSEAALNISLATSRHNCSAAGHWKRATCHHRLSPTTLQVDPACLKASGTGAWTTSIRLRTARGNCCKYRK